MDSLGSYIPSPGHTGWDLEGAHKRVWAVGLGIFDPCKKGSLVQALVSRPVRGEIWLMAVSISFVQIKYNGRFSLATDVLITRISGAYGPLALAPAEDLMEPYGPIIIGKIKGDKIKIINNKKIV